MSSFPALVIGIAEYDDGRPLVGVKSDVTNMTKELRRIGYTVNSVTTLLPQLTQRVPREKLVTLIKRFATRAKLAGGGVLYISGNGTTKKIGSQFEPAICPSDVVAAGPLLMVELRALLGNVASQVVIILDCGLRGSRSYGSGQQFEDAVASLPRLSAARYLGGAAPETQSGGRFTSALIAALSDLETISDASLATSSVGVSVSGLVAAIQETLSAAPEQSGNPGVEIDGSTNGVYVIKTQSAPKTLVALPPGQFLPGFQPAGFAPGLEYWPEGFGWPSTFLIERAQTISGLNATSSDRYEWQTFPSSTSSYPADIPNARWHMTLETVEDEPVTVGAGFFCRHATGDYLLWFASDAALAPGGNVLRVGYSSAHGVNLRLRLSATSDAVPSGMRWVRCDRVT
ncbi:MAG: Caspase domain [Pseudomonadota bacterium]